MPKYRALHVKITDSFDVNDMPDDFTRLLWSWLPLGLDCEGRGIYNASWIKAKIMPLRDDVKNEHITAAMEWFCKRGMVIIYQVENRSYFYIPTWTTYQRGTEKEAKSILPVPPELVESKSGVTQEIVSVAESVSVYESVNESVNESDCKNINPSQDQKEKPSKKYKPTIPREDLSLMIDALATVTGMDQALNYSRLAREAKELILADYSTDQVLKIYQAGGAWWKKDWRGQKNEMPQIGLIRSTISQLSKANGNGKKPAGCEELDPDAEFLRMNPNGPAELIEEARKRLEERKNGHGN